MKHNILSLDFWQDTVIYGGSVRKSEKKKSPPQPTCIRQAATASGVRFSLTLKTKRQKSSGSRIGIK